VERLAEAVVEATLLFLLKKGRAGERPSDSTGSSTVPVGAVDVKVGGRSVRH